MLKRPFSAILVAALIVFGPTIAARANPVAEFYKTNPVTIAVGHQTGTAFDLYARLLARHFGRHMPGNPEITVQNMNGASGLRSLNWLANIAPKDGTALATMVFTAPFEPLLGEGHGKFDATKLVWIGNMDSSVGTCGVSRRSGISHFDELFEKELLVGATGSSGPLRATSMALKNLLGVKLNIVPGYKGAGDLRLAIQRGEVHGACGSTLSAVRSAFTDLTEAGDYRLILQAGAHKDPTLEGVPHVYDYAKSDDDRRIFDVVFGIQTLGRSFVAPAETPGDRASALRQAFWDAMRDPALIAEAAKARLELSPMQGEEIAAIVKTVYSTPATLVERARKAVE